MNLEFGLLSFLFSLIKGNLWLSTCKWWGNRSTLWKPLSNPKSKATFLHASAGIQTWTWRQNIWRRVVSSFLINISPSNIFPTMLSPERFHVTLVDVRIIALINPAWPWMGNDFLAEILHIIVKYFNEKHSCGQAHFFLQIFFKIFLITKL